MESLNKLLGRFPIVLAKAKVQKVDGDVCHVVLEDTEEDVWNCTLNSILENSNDKMVVYPKVGSMVTVGLINRDSAVILSVSEVDKIYFKKDKSEMIFDKDGFEFNRDGENLKQVLNDFQTGFGKLCDELSKVVVSIGVSPNVPVINQIKESIVTTNKNALNKILK